MLVIGIGEDYLYKTSIWCCQCPVLTLLTRDVTTVAREVCCYIHCTLNMFHSHIQMYWTQQIPLLQPGRHTLEIHRISDCLSTSCTQTRWQWRRWCRGPWLRGWRSAPPWGRWRGVWLWWSHGSVEDRRRSREAWWWSRWPPRRGTNDCDQSQRDLLICWKLFQLQVLHKPYK